MKLAFSIILLSINLYGQIPKIKVKKIITQDKMQSVTTIAGIYNGKISLTKLFLDNKFIISNNIDKIKVVSYDVYFIDNRFFKLNLFAAKGDSLNEDIKNAFLKLNPKFKVNVFINEIKGVNETGDTLYLNPIALKIGGE